MDPYGGCCHPHSQAYPPQAYPAQLHECHHARRCCLASYFANSPTVMVYCMADPNYVLTVRNNKVIMAQYSPCDLTQQWYKDDKYSTTVRDKDGFPAFSLVNKASSLALKHSVVYYYSSVNVELVPCNLNKLDSSVLWSMSQDFGFGHRMRMIDDISLNLALSMPRRRIWSEGTGAVLWKWREGKNQRWIISPTNESYLRR